MYIIIINDNLYTINNIFDKVYLINLERDIHKLNIMKNKLDKLKIKYELFKAIDGSKLQEVKLLRFGNKGAVGCKMSHIKNYKKMQKNNNYSKILILEDDLYFLNNFIEEFDTYYKELLNQNKNWELLYFGACNRGGKKSYLF